MKTLLLGCMGTSALAVIVYMGKKARILYAKMHHYQLADATTSSPHHFLTPARVVSYSIAIGLLYWLTRSLDINSSYVLVGFILCMATFLASMHLSKLLITKHFTTDAPNNHPINKAALELSITIPCTVVVVMLSLFVTSPFILASAFAMILLCLDQMSIFFSR